MKQLGGGGLVCHLPSSNVCPPHPLPLEAAACGEVTGGTAFCEEALGSFLHFVSVVKALNSTAM